jgi:branched-chain amino acid aminotransferase
MVVTPSHVLAFEGASVDLNSVIVYTDGRYCRYDEAKIGLMTHGLHYGTGCFEGVRGFWDAQDEELYLLHVRDHYVRLAQSANILYAKLPNTPDELTEITAELCRRNNYRQDIYIRPLMYKANEDVGVRLHNVRDAFAIIAIPFDKYFDAERGLAACISSWRRIDDTAIPARGKITGSYINSALAKTEAQLSGFDEAILLSHDGHVAEGSAENLFMVKNGVVYTPDHAQNILEGITRRSVMEICRVELDLPIVERAIDRSELYSADELFFTGSAVGVQYVTSLDRRTIGSGELGPIARRIIAAYEKAIRNKDPRFASWVIATYGSRVAATA